MSVNDAAESKPDPIVDGESAPFRVWLPEMVVRDLDLRLVEGAEIVSTGQEWSPKRPREVGKRMLRVLDREYAMVRYKGLRYWKVPVEHSKRTTRTRVDPFGSIWLGEDAE